MSNSESYGQGTTISHLGADVLDVENVRAQMAV